MMRDSTDTCAGCESYPLSEAAGNAGRAICPEFEREQEYNDRACVLHNPAKDRRERQRIVIQLTKKGTEIGKQNQPAADPA